MSLSHPLMGSKPSGRTSTEIAVDAYDRGVLMGERRFIERMQKQGWFSGYDLTQVYEQLDALAKLVTIKPEGCEWSDIRIKCYLHPKPTREMMGARIVRVQDLKGSGVDVFFKETGLWAIERIGVHE